MKAEAGRAASPPQDRPRKIFCVINCGVGAGAAAQREEIAVAFASRGVECAIDLCPSPRGLARRVRAAVTAGADVVAAGGGDGTVGTVADLLAGSEVALGVLPLGTLNHFARDVGIPLELSGAVEVICRGATRRVDVGEVNGRCFINNSSLGAYPEMVRFRERWRPRLGKWPALLLGGLAVLFRFPVLKLGVEVGGERRRRYLSLLFVGNNAYQLEWPALGTRARLDEGCLSLWLLGGTSRLRLLRSVFRLLRGRGWLAPEVEASRPESLTVTSRRRLLRVAVDGEVLRLRPPLNYRIRPLALRVCVPGEKGAG
ncbi:MAG TPA: diacylglycerol kinase family protein [Blastocatellia bacterium]|nr:diacylglycerol kinase family protein [Blastocatellia bacterium]